MYVQVRIFGSEVTPLCQISCRSIDETLDELRNKIARKLNISDDSRVRLFCDGKELQNGHSLYDYNIKVNCVVHVIVKPLESPNTTSDHCDHTLSNDNNNSLKQQNNDEHSQNHRHNEENKEEQEEVVVNEDDYYSIGNFVDALHAETGAWFEAKIVKITLNQSSLAHTYYVQFDKPSLGTNIPLKLFQLRPQASVKLAFDNLNEGDSVLANFKSGSLSERGYWYEYRIEKKRNNESKLYASALIGGNAVLKRQTIRSTDELYKIECNHRRDERSKREHELIQFGPKSKRLTPPDCDNCCDNISLRCKKCSCNECGGKNSPEKQIMCDECDAIYHIWCLNEPLTDVPDDDWYCNRCRNVDQKQMSLIENRHLDRRKKSLNRTGIKEWGRGMACMGRTQICNTVGKHHFGPIPGVDVGMWWRFRFQASEAGVHTPLVAGIHGKENCGAFSIVFCCSYDEDIDLGDEFYYTASGGKDSNGKSRVGGPQTKDQELKRCNKALAVNCFAPFNGEKGANAKLDWNKGKPVRVLRSGNARGANKKSSYLPKVGVRYDGIYKVVKYWPQIGDSGFLVWRYLLRRDDESPAPWTKQGLYRSRKLGLKIIYPPGYGENTASKRSWKMDENAFRNKKSCSTFAISDDILCMIEKDERNAKVWQNILNHVKNGKLEFYRVLEDSFKCVCCLDTVKNPITTVCNHNICELCLKRSFESGVDTCPTCRKRLTKMKQKLNVNVELNQILSRLL